MRNSFFLILILLVSNFKTLTASEAYRLDSNFATLKLTHQVGYLEDSLNQIKINDILQGTSVSTFTDSLETFNFEQGYSAFWFRIHLKSIHKEKSQYFIELRNPDIAAVSFYVVDSGKIEKTVVTGELFPKSSRDVISRYYVCEIELKANETKTVYVNVNNYGRSLYVPIYLKSKYEFIKKEFSFNTTNWFFYGVIFFIIFLNIYMFFITKNKSNLYVFAYIFSGFLFLLYYDGYHFLFNHQEFHRTFKFIAIFSFSFFMILFTRSNTLKNHKKQFWIIDIFLALNILLPFTLFFSYPVAYIGEFGSRFLTGIGIILVVVLSAVSVNRKNTSSVVILLAHVTLLLAFIIVQLKEFNLVSYSLLSESSIKIGLALQNMLLTVAVLEQFRSRQKEVTDTIKENLKRINEQNHKLEDVNQALEKLSIAASNTNNAIALCTPAGEIEWSNRSFLSYLDAGQREALRNCNLTYKEVFKDVTSAEYYKECLQELKPIDFEIEFVQNEQRKWKQISLTPFIVKNSIKNVIVIDTDISTLKQYEAKIDEERQKALESDRLKTVFLRNMSHEVRTPLNGIVGFSDLLLNINRLSEVKRTKYVELIKQNSDQLQVLIDDILDISLIDSKQLKVDNIECNLYEVISEVVNFFKKHKLTMGKAQLDILFRCEMEDKKILLFSDPARIRQVITNLIKNAIKFTSQGYVSISLSADKDTYIITVEDSGTGISSEKQNVIFQHFRQGDEELSRKFGGTGIGLSICKGILTMLGGTIRLDAEYKKGARFVFTLPKCSDLVF